MNTIAYHPGEWVSFFSTTTGAAATLVGLVIVAISVNIKMILENSHLPANAAATIATLLLALIVSMAVLLPGQPGVFLGWEVIAFTVPIGLLQLWSAKRSRIACERDNRPAHEWKSWTLVGIFEILPFILGGVSLIVSRGGGIYWLAAGVIAVFLFTMLSTWVLLVEILR